MTLTMKDNIRDWQSLCEDQMNSSRHPLVDLNVALHQFYGYLMALQQTGFITEEEQTAAMERGRLELSDGFDRVPIATSALDGQIERSMAALRKGIQKHGVPKEVYVDNGREYLTFKGTHLGKSEVCAAMQELCARRKEQLENREQERKPITRFDMGQPSVSEVAKQLRAAGIKY